MRPVPAVHQHSERTQISSGINIRLDDQTQSNLFYYSKEVSVCEFVCLKQVITETTESIHQFSYLNIDSNMEGSRFAGSQSESYVLRNASEISEPFS